MKREKKSGVQISYHTILPSKVIGLESELPALGHTVELTLLVEASVSWPWGCENGVASHTSFLHHKVGRDRESCPPFLPLPPMVPVGVKGADPHPTAHLGSTVELSQRTKVQVKKLRA